MITKLRIGDAGRILDALHMLSAPEISRELTIDTKAAYSLGRNRKKLEGPVVDAREQFNKEREKIVADAKVNVRSNAEIEAAIMKVNTDLADIEVEFDLFPVNISQLNGKGNGVLVDILARLDGVILKDDTAPELVVVPTPAAN